jgi:hypothetical protein
MTSGRTLRGGLVPFIVLTFFLLACGTCANPFARGESFEDNPAFSGIELGEVVTAAAVGEGNRPLETRSTFSTNDPIIFVVAEARRVDAGTTIFARWFRGGEPFEDTPAITADRQYTNTYIEFHIEPVNRQLEPGNYSVQLYVNGNPGPRAEFTVQ